MTLSSDELAQRIVKINRLLNLQHGGENSHGILGLLRYQGLIPVL